MKSRVGVREATHVKVVGGGVEKIVSKWGVDNGRLAKPSKGGFGVVTESGRRVDMFHAGHYLRDNK